MHGIVIPCGANYFPSGYVTVRMLRHVGCTLPIEAWSLNPDENPGWHRRALEPYGVTFRCAANEQRHAGGACRILGGFELKPYAMLHSSFDEVLLLDADCYPVRDPTFLFDHSEYRRTGAVFWPDWWDRDVQAGTWKAFGLADPMSRPVESGAVLIDKRRCLRELRLTNWLNQHSDYAYKWSRGDKDTFRLAWHYFRTDYAMPDHEPVSEWPAMIQPDFAGNPLFVHRMNGKFTLRPTRFTTTIQRQQRNDNLPMEAEAWAFLRDLQRYRDNEPIPTITPGGPVAVCQLGRFGDCISLLPAMRWLSERCKVTHIVHKRYADVTAGLPWLTQWVWDGDPVDPFGAAEEYQRANPGVRVMNTMVGNNDPYPLPSRGGKTFAHVQWERTGCPLELFDQLPTVLENRNSHAESSVSRYVPAHIPLVLFNATHFNPGSRPTGFRDGSELFKLLRSRRLMEYYVLDLGCIRAPRFQDLLGLYERARLLISTDTGTLHLGNVTQMPTIGLVLDDPYRRAPMRRHWIAQFTYGWASNHLADVVDAAESFLKGKVCDELELCC